MAAVTDVQHETGIVTDRLHSEKFAEEESWAHVDDYPSGEDCEQGVCFLLSLGRACSQCTEYSKTSGSRKPALKLANTLSCTSS